MFNHNHKNRANDVNHWLLILLSYLRTRPHRQGQERHVRSIRNSAGWQSQETHQDHATGIESRVAREILFVSSALNVTLQNKSIFTESNFVAFQPKNA